MCGRYTLTYEKKVEMDDFLNAIDRGNLPGMLSPNASNYGNYNVAPTHTMPVAYVNDDGDRIIELMHWGFMGWKPKPGQRPFMPINTRDDSIAKKPMWNRAFNSKRCIIPLNGFYEWTGSGKNKTPHYIYPKEGTLLAAAGIFSNLSPKEGFKSYSVITTHPNSLMEDIHNRMPAFLHPSEFDDWLNPSNEEALLLDMLEPYPDDALLEHIVGKDVGRVQNNYAALTEKASLF